MKITIYSKRTQLLIDGGICGIAWVIAHLLRYAGNIPSTLVSRQMLLLLAPVVIGQLLTNGLLGIYRLQWRYIKTEDALRVARAYLGYAALLIGTALLAGSRVPLLNIPISIVIVLCLLSVVGAISVRLARRIFYRRASMSKGVPQRFLIIGAGWHGATVATEMPLHKGIEVVGFLDDDPEKQGAVIAGVPVLGRSSDLAHVVRARGVDEVLVCTSPKSRQSLQVSALETSKGSPVRSRIIPTLEEILQTTSIISVTPGVNVPPGSNGHAKSDLAHGNGSKPNGKANARHAQIVSGPVTPGVKAPPGSNGHAKSDLVHGNDSKPNGNGDARHAHVVSKAGGNGAAAKPLRRRPTSLPGNGKAGGVNPAPPVQNRTILITGGAGFIGSSLAEKLVEHNRVILLDQSFAQGPIQYTSLLRHRNVDVVQGSIMVTDLRSLVKEADVVVHAAAILGVNRVCNFARETLETNYVGTSRLLKALEAKPSVQRFIYFSTSEVFGVNSYRVDETSRPTIGPIAESRWSYAMSKLAGEHLVASYFRETRLPVAIVRPFNIFGPRRTGDYALRRFILSALHGEPLLIHGDGTQIRSWCYIEDFCSALLQMIARPEAIGEDFNIGHPGNTLTIHELAQKVIQFTGSSSPLTYCESPFPDVAIRVPALDKARRLLGYEPKYDLSAGLKLTIQWHRENLDMLQTPILPVPAVPKYSGEERAA
jgi:dTDP-glucose 4,6-dehydratase